MSLNIRAIALSAGLTAAALFVICAAAVAVAPEATTKFAGFLIHADLTGLSRPLSLGNFIGGLAAWPVGTALTVGFAAWLYNRLGARASMAR